MDQQQHLLREVFGYPDFRPGQRRLIDSLLAGRDVLGIMPTGAGKSICYQLPALMLPGITVVVSPLISLMKDQVFALVQSGVRAAYLNSSLTERQYHKALENARAGLYKIIYVAPERLMTPDFLALSAGQTISMVCVDEAHCVSQWGQDFRPGYLTIPDYIDTLPARPVVGAFTATATHEVKEDILRLLRLNDPQVLVTGFDRPNLYFGVLSPSDKYAAARNYLETHPDKSGILYCLTRKTVDEVTERLCADGFSAVRYHAGLDAEERRQNQDAFVYDRARIMVATNAFGMGIDKSNVSFVLHYNMPKNIESYYQEAGRAGRDGSPADCILLYSGRDVITNRFLLEQTEPNPDLSPEVQQQLRRRDEERLRQMTFYATSHSCLREFLLRYFGEHPAGYCGNCSVCLSGFELVDAADAAACVLRAIGSSGRQYGVTTWMDLLRGAKNEKLLHSPLVSGAAYGALSEWERDQLRALFSLLLEKGLLARSEGDRPVLSLTDAGRDFLAAPAPLMLHRPSAPTRAKKPAPSEGPIDASLLAQLKALRLSLAKRAGVPAFVIFTDTTLEKICAAQPKTKEEFLQLPGVGKVKCERYADAFLELLEKSCQNHS